MVLARGSSDHTAMWGTRIKYSQDLLLKGPVIFGNSQMLPGVKNLVLVLLAWRNCEEKCRVQGHNPAVKAIWEFLKKLSP